MKSNLLKATSLSLLLALIPLLSCSTMTNFNQQAYTQTISIKVDALNLMDSAVYEYAVYAAKVSDLQVKIQKAYEYERNRPKNEITVQLWDKLLDKEGHLLGGFLMRWQNQGKQSSVFINASKKQVGMAFDVIAGLESQKLKSSELK